MPQKIYGLLTLNQVAERISRSYSFVYDEVAKGRLTSYKLGGQYSVSEADLEAYIKARRRPALRERRQGGKEALSA
jgi:excisionase family DNA binding protein